MTKLAYSFGSFSYCCGICLASTVPYSIKLQFLAISFLVVIKPINSPQDELRSLKKIQDRTHKLGGTLKSSCSGVRDYLFKTVKNSSPFTAWRIRFLGMLPGRLPFEWTSGTKTGMPGRVKRKRYCYPVVHPCPISLVTLSFLYYSRAKTAPKENLPQTRFLLNIKLPQFINSGRWGI